MNSVPFVTPTAPVPMPGRPAANWLSNAEYCSRTCYCAIALTIAGSIYLLINRPAALPVTNALLALAIIWAGLSPAFIYLLSTAGKAGVLPFLPLFGTSFALIYGLTTFSVGQIPGQLSASVVTASGLTMALTGLLLLYAGFALTKYFGKDLIAPLSLGASYDPGWLRTLIWILLIGHMCFLYLPAFRSFKSLTSLAEAAGYAAYGVLYLQWKQKRLPPIQTFLFLFVCIPAELLWRFTSGALAQVVIFGVFFQLIIWYERRRIPWVLITATILFFIPLQPVKSEYRRYTYQNGRYAHLSPIGKARLFGELAVNYYSNGIHKEKRPTDAAASRVADIRILSFVMARTPEPVGYWNGTTYKLLLTNLVPRFLWPGKPPERIGQDFGHRYGFLAERDTITSMNLPWLVEMYINFGVWGVLAGMPLVGCVFALLTEKLGRPGMNYLEFVVGATILFRLSIDQESNISLVVGPILLLIVALSSFFRIGYWMHGPERAQAPSLGPRTRRNDVRAVGSTVGGD